MQKPIAALLIAAAVLLNNGASAAVWDFDFDEQLAGFSKVAELLVTNCTTDIEAQINFVLCGKPIFHRILEKKSMINTTSLSFIPPGKVTGSCIEVPTVNQDLPHVTCSEDRVMGQAINFTLYKTDDDPSTTSQDRQRIEMKVYNPSPVDLKASNNSHFIYTHWFKLDLDYNAGDGGFNHIFQLKPVTDVSTSPLFTLSISE